MKGLGTPEEEPASPRGTKLPISHGWGAGQPKRGSVSLGTRDKDQKGTHLGARQGRGCMGSAWTSPPGQHPAPWLAVGRALRILLPAARGRSEGWLVAGPQGAPFPSSSLPKSMAKFLQFGARAGRRRGSKEPLALVLLQIGSCSLRRIGFAGSGATRPCALRATGAAAAPVAPPVLPLWGGLLGSEHQPRL